MRWLATFLIAVTAHAADWTVLRAPGIELYSDASERTARTALNRLTSLSEMLPKRTEAGPVPIRLFVFA